MKSAMKKLTGEIMTIHAEGSYLKAREMIGKYVGIRAEMQRMPDTLNDIPTDIEPSYTSAR